MPFLYANGNGNRGNGSSNNNSNRRVPPVAIPLFRRFGGSIHSNRQTTKSENGETPMIIDNKVVDGVLPQSKGTHEDDDCILDPSGYTSIDNENIVEKFPLEEQTRWLAELVQGLSSEKAHVRYKSARSIKNAAIGSRVRKSILIKLGAFDKLLVAIKTHTDENMLIEAVTALGSLCYAGGFKLLNDTPISILLHLLQTKQHSQDSRVLLAIIRSLRLILQTKQAPSALLENRDTVLLLILLLSNPNQLVVEAACSILAKCLELTTDEYIRLFIIEHGGLSALLNILFSRNTYPKSKHAALSALSSLYKTDSSGNLPPALLQEILQPLEDPWISSEAKNPFQFVLNLVKEKLPMTQLIAASCVANICKLEQFPYEDYKAILQCTVLPIVIQLLDESAPLIREETPRILAELIYDRIDLQKAATEAGAIRKLAAYISQPFATNKLHENVLLAIHSISELREESRRQVVATNILPTIEEMLESDSNDVRVAACKCVRSLSRSVKILRKSMAESKIPTIILKLLDDSDVAVQIWAVAAICNFVLEFAPMKKSLIDAGVIDKLTAFAKNKEYGLQLYGIWALQNLTFQASVMIKQEVIEKLTVEKIYDLLDVEDVYPTVTEHILGLLRNVFHYDVDVSAGWFDLGILLEKLKVIGKTYDTYAKVLTQMLFILCNLSTGTETIKNQLIASGIPQVLSVILQATIALQGECQQKPNLPLTLEDIHDIQIGISWCVLNLAWQFDIGVNDRIAKLKELDFKESFKMLADVSSNFEVKDRAKTLLEVFSHAPRDTPMKVTTK